MDVRARIGGYRCGERNHPPAKTIAIWVFAGKPQDLADLKKLRDTMRRVRRRHSASWSRVLLQTYGDIPEILATFLIQLYDVSKLHGDPLPFEHWDD